MISRKRKISQTEKYNRLYFMLTIIFLLSGVIIYRLYDLQVMRHDLFTALASDQHLVYNELKPERGRIFIQDQGADSQATLYPISINKDFALVYAIPSEVDDVASSANALFELFDQEQVEEEVELLLESLEQFRTKNENGDKIIYTDEQKEFREIKKQLEIKLRQEEITLEYEQKLSKPNDPYEPINNKVDKDTLVKLLAFELPGIYHIMQSHRYYPEPDLGGHMLGFVGYGEEERQGQYGLEGFFNEELSGVAGSVRTERSAEGAPIIINNREYQAPIDGSDLVLTIVRSIQFTACAKLDQYIERFDAEGGSVVVMDPFSGAILAMCSAPDFDPNNYNQVEQITHYNNPVIFEAYEPGSIFKVFTMAAGIDQGKVTPQTIYNDQGWINIEGWPKPIKNSDFDTHGAHGWVDMVTVLSESLNTGSIFVEKQVGSEVFADYVRKFGFGEKTGIELETEGLTNIRNLARKRIRPVEAATASFGQGITATPLQTALAYSAIANGGILMKPYLVSEIIPPSGEKQITSPRQIRRVIQEKTALLVSGMMVNVVDGGHAKLAGVPGYFVAGKTGTAQVADKIKGGYLEDKTIHTFVGFAPVEEPRFVILAKLDKPANARFAAGTAAPLFGEIAEFILNYWQVPKER